MNTLAAVVAVHGVRVGLLQRFGDDEDHRFDFDEAWLGDAHRPTLGQLFEDRRPEPIETSGLSCWFAHLLPQGPWARHLRQSAKLDDDEAELELLLAVGGDLPGAVTLERAVPRLSGHGGYRARPQAQGRLRFSLAGAQFKLSVRPGERGLVVPVDGEGAGRYIAKFHDPAFPGLPRVEHATTAWARRAGVATHHARLARTAEFDDLPQGVPTGDGTVFLATRFDRSGDDRVHYEDFGQILDRPPGVPGQYTGSYEEIVRLVARLAPEDVPELLRRIAFAMVSGNGDAHLKNWAVHYPDRRTPGLAPAYDLVATVVYPHLDRELALDLGGRRAFASLDATALRDLPAAAQRDEAEVSRLFRSAVESALDSWRDTAEDGWREDERAAIEAHFGSVPLIRDLRREGG